MEHLKQETLYPVRRNLSTLPPAMSANMTWIGTGSQKRCRNVQDADTALPQKAQLAPLTPGAHISPTFLCKQRLKEEKNQ